MKNIKENVFLHSIYEFIVNKPLHNINKEITLELFIADIEQILNNIGVIYDDKSSKPSDKLYIYKRELSARYEPLVTGCDTTFTEYNISYLLDNYLSFRDNSFYLTLWVWFDKDLNRPRYKFNNFGLLLPATRTQGYHNSYKEVFDSYKVINEYYDKVINSIENIVNTFKDNTNIMQMMYDKCRSRYKNPTNADFTKIFKKIYPGVIK